MASYRGTLALNAPLPVPDDARQMVVLAVDVWESGFSLRGTADYDAEQTFWLALDVPSPFDDGVRLQATVPLR